MPNTNRHAMEGSNPVWMTGVGYDNWEVEGEEEQQEEVGSQARAGEGRGPAHYDHFDSLDANVLNESYEDEEEEEDEDDKQNEHFPDHHDDDDDDDGVPDHLRGDVLYSRSYHSGGGSTLLMSSTKV